MTYKQAIQKARGYALCGNKQECQKWINSAARRGKISRELLVSLDKTLRAGMKRGKGGARKGRKRKNPAIGKLPITLHFTRTFSKGNLKGLTHDDAINFESEARAIDFVRRINAKKDLDYKITSHSLGRNANRNPKSANLVAIENKSNGQQGKPIDLRTAKTELARMLKNWRLDRGSDPFPYHITPLRNPSKLKRLKLMSKRRGKGKGKCGCKRNPGKAPFNTEAKLWKAFHTTRQKMPYGGAMLSVRDGAVDDGVKILAQFKGDRDAVNTLERAGFKKSGNMQWK